jgi:hypothetical protein
MKTAVVSNVIPYSLIDVYRRFGGNYCLLLQGRIVSHTSNWDIWNTFSRKSTAVPVDGWCSVELLCGKRFDSGTSRVRGTGSKGWTTATNESHTVRCVSAQGVILLVLFVWRLGNDSSLSKHTPEGESIERRIWERYGLRATLLNILLNMFYCIVAREEKSTL